MSRILAFSSFLLLAAGSCFSLGCGEGKLHPDDPRNFPVHPVVGKIVDREGKPLTYGGEILFTPEQNGMYVSRSPLAPDGTFKLTTDLKGRGKVDGAPAGEYTVTVTPATQVYMRPTMNAGQKYSVKPGDNNLTVQMPGVDEFKVRKK